MTDEEVQECCCCGTAGVHLNHFVHKSIILKDDGREHRHCDICYSTFIGNTCTTPGGYDRSDRDLHQLLAAVGNVIIKEIRKT